MPEEMLEKFTYYFVAYIDILGFSKMVEFDIQNPDSSDLNLTKLYQIFKTTKESFDNDDLLQVIQFSDSVVFAAAYDVEKFPAFLKSIGQFQYNLLSQGLLCRGGISFGKHFYKDGFLFSSGLIEAYLIEKNLSRYPRIVISEELLDSLYPHSIDPNCKILKENDETFFLDYIGDNDLFNTQGFINKILQDNSSSDASIKEKHRWLCEYFDNKVKISGKAIANISTPRFSNI